MAARKGLRALRSCRVATRPARGRHRFGAVSMTPSATTGKPLTVTQLTLAIKTKVENDFPSVWVTGEITGVARPASGHIYFTLKDPGAQIPSVMWRGTALRHKFDLKDGLSVVIRGRLTVYPP